MSKSTSKSVSSALANSLWPPPARKRVRAIVIIVVHHHIVDMLLLVFRTAEGLLRRRAFAMFLLELFIIFSRQGKPSSELVLPASSELVLPSPCEGNENKDRFLLLVVFVRPPSDIFDADLNFLKWHFDSSGTKTIRSVSFSRPQEINQNKSRR